MKAEPKRALDGVEPAVSNDPTPAKRGSHRVRASLAGLAVVSVLGMVGTFVVSPTIEDQHDRSDPTAAVPAVDMVTREDKASRGEASRSELRQALNPIGDVSLEPVASPTPEPSPTPSPTPTPEPTPSPTPTPTPEKPKVPELGKVVGERYASSPVNVRSGPGTGFDVVTTLAVGKAVSVTDVVVDGTWQQVKVGKRTGFISAKYLSEKKPEAPEPTKRKAPAPKESEAPSKPSTGTCKAAKSAESGLTPRTRNVLHALCNQFPNISSYGGYRPGGGSFHGSGRAIDAMISGEAGWEVARWARANASALGITEVIYAQKIWTVQRSGDGWRSMPNRGSDSANHYDHVHISVR